MKQLPRATMAIAAAVAAIPSVAGTAVDDTAETTVNTPITIDVLANDLNVDNGWGGEGSLFEWDPALIESEGSNSLLVVNSDNTVTYTPGSDFVGTEKFTYAIYDGSNNSYASEATVTVIVTEPEPEPTPTPTPEPTPTPTPEPSVEPTPAPSPTPVPRLDLTEYVEKGNNLNAAKAIMTSCLSASESSSFSAACDELLSLDPNSEVDINSVVNGIAAEELLSQRRVLSELGRSKINRLYQSISSIRAGQNTHSVAANGRSVVYGGAAGDATSSPWNFLSSVYMRNSSYSRTQNESAFESESSGGMVGLSYRLSRDLFWGAAIDWSQYDLEYLNSNGEIDADQYGLTAFLSWYLGSLSLDSQVGYGASNATISREVTYPTTVTAVSENSGTQLDASVQVEWDLGISAWRVRPYLRLDYMDVSIGAYEEEGASQWLVEVEDQSLTELNTAFGLGTQYTVNSRWGVWVPELKFSLIQKSALDDSNLSFRFSAADNNSLFELTADENDEFFYEWQINSVFVHKNGISTFISGNSISGHEHLEGFGINAGLNIEF